MASNLTNTKPQAEGFYNTLSATRQFAWGDDLGLGIRSLEQQNVGSAVGGHGHHVGRRRRHGVLLGSRLFSSGFLFGVKIDDAKAKPSRDQLG